MAFLIVEIREGLDGVPLVSVLLTFLEKTRDNEKLRVLCCSVLSHYKRICRSLSVVLSLASCVEDAKNENFVKRVLSIIVNERESTAITQELHLLADYGLNRIYPFLQT